MTSHWHLSATMVANISKASLVKLCLCKYWLLKCKEKENIGTTTYKKYVVHKHLKFWRPTQAHHVLPLLNTESHVKKEETWVWFLRIWLYILKIMSNCRMTSINWNQGLISLLGKGMWIANTMLLASIFLAMASSKVWILSHLLGPQGMNHFFSCRCLAVSTHFVAR